MLNISESFMSPVSFPSLITGTNDTPWSIMMSRAIRMPSFSSTVPAKGTTNSLRGVVALSNSQGRSGCKRELSDAFQKVRQVDEPEEIVVVIEDKRSGVTVFQLPVLRNDPQRLDCIRNRGFSPELGPFISRNHEL